MYTFNAKYIKNVDLNLKWGVYENGMKALLLVDPNTGEEWCKASISVDRTSFLEQLKRPIAEDEIIIKNYSENQGILEELIRHKIVSPPIDTLYSGIREVHLCKVEEQ